jgi:hypothetical protein
VGVIILKNLKISFSVFEQLNFQAFPMVQPVIACGLDWQFGELLSQSWDI